MPGVQITPPPFAGEHHKKIVARTRVELYCQGEGLLKVRGSHVHWKSGNISETVLGKDVVTTGH